MYLVHIDYKPFAPENDRKGGEDFLNILLAEFYSM